MRFGMPEKENYRTSLTHSVYTLLNIFLQTQLHPRRYKERKN